MTTPMLPMESLVAKAVTDALREKREREGDRPTSDGTRGRGSMAHSCSRRIAFDAARVPRTVPDSDFNLITWEIGQDAHDRIQAGFKRHFDARLEVPVSYRPERDFSGNVDVVYDFNPLTGERRDNLVTGEIKSMKQYGFDKAVGKLRSQKDPAGPKPEHITQAAMYGLAPQLQSQYLHLIYYAKDTGQMAEWILDVDKPLTHLDNAPTPRQLATDELDRMAGIFALLDEGQVAKPIIPGVGHIVDPNPADHWQCRFCPHQPTCSAIGPERAPLTDAENVAVRLAPPARPKPKPSPDDLT